MPQPQRQKVSLQQLKALPYQRRNVCVLPSSVADMMDRNAVRTKCSGSAHTHFTRDAVVAAVARGEMRWVDKHHNTATYNQVAACTWQKTRSGNVHTMQFKAGQKGRHVPVNQREPEELAVA